MAGVTQVRRVFGEAEAERVNVNGQPGRVLRGPADPQLSEATRLAIAQALARLQSGGEVDPTEVAAIIAGDIAGHGPNPEVAVRDVLTVDVVDGRIQTVRIVRNPDKLNHL